ncbi:MAG: DUF2155 domain-containing protein [Holosporaceae bacterium]|jgi:hypothetical protein|nr:DUF2155 domain-containing protein [Holosporaceae bacterium]
MQKIAKKLRSNVALLACFLRIAFIFVCCNYLLAGTISIVDAAEEVDDTENVDEQCDEIDESFWESHPEEIDNTNMQILDKISGKVFWHKIKLNRPVTFGSIILQLRRCFRNSPEDDREVYAYIEVFENKRKIFSGWKLASYPSINVLEHPVYDVRVEY